MEVVGIFSLALLLKNLGHVQHYFSLICMLLFFVCFLFFFSATMYKKHGHAQIQLPETDVVFYSL